MSSKRDYILSRGTKASSPLGSTLFVGLRTLDIFIQYGFLARGLASPLLNALSITHGHADSPTFALGLPLQQLIILAMAAGTTLKQSYARLFILQEPMEPSTAIMVSVFNTIFNSANSILSLTAAASYFTPSLLTTPRSELAQLSPLFALGVASYVVGTAAELTSEIQRRNFKADPKNQGKPFTAGLFSLARHINYGGYTIMRTGYAVATGGWIWGAAVFGFFFYDFATRGVPVLDEYCSNRVSGILSSLLKHFGGNCVNVVTVRCIVDGVQETSAVEVNTGNLLMGDVGFEVACVEK
jgi:protein-S-isoprenylcysteine O-methyltransferase Ste14